MRVSLMLLGCAALLCMAVSQPVDCEPLAKRPEEWLSVRVARADSNPQTLGPLRLGMSESEVRDKLGPQQGGGRRSMMMGSEEFTYTWDYTELGVTVFFSAFDETSPGTVMAIRVKAPCDWTAVGGLKVGMSIEAASKILQRQASGTVSPIGSVGSEMAGLYYTLSETAVVAGLEMGMVSVLYVGPNLP